MHTTLLIAAWLAPLLLAPLALSRRGYIWPAVAVLPALLAALQVPVGTTEEIPWLVLGLQLELDATGRLFLLFSALLWLFAALHAALTASGSMPALH